MPRRNAGTPGSRALQVTPLPELVAPAGVRPALRLASLLCVHSYYSPGAGVASPRRLVGRARDLGYASLGLADEGSVAGVVELAEHAREQRVKPTYGATVRVRLDGRRAQEETYPLVLIAASRAGYQTLNELLSLAYEREDRALTLATLIGNHEDLFCLTGGRLGFPTQLFGKRRLPEVLDTLRVLKGVFRDRLFVQAYHDGAPGDRRRRDYLRSLARDTGVRLIAAPEVRLLEAADLPLLDALTCARLGIDLGTPHPQRPRNHHPHLRTPEDWGRALPFPDALANAERLAREATFDLLPERLTPPGIPLPEGVTPDQALEERALLALVQRYPAGQLRRARERLEYELATVRGLGLAPFFLTAAAVADYCAAQGILAAGRGSAASSILCYLLGITQVEPIARGLLFERFLTSGKTVMPDVDFDISSARRREVISWVEEQWGARHEVMAANRVTYRLPSAVQDLGRALGIPAQERDRLTRALGRDYRGTRPHRAREAERVFTEVLGDAPVKDVLIGLLERMEGGFVRHLAPHSGGVILSKYPITHYTPIQTSSGGIKLGFFDKDDVEKLGLIKLDLLGLRMLAALERAREDVLRVSGRWLDYGSLPDDPRVWEEIRSGDTLGLFQIESPGQMRLSTLLQPRRLRDLAHQVALHRPGPIQSGSVHPYIRRRRGEEPTPRLREPLHSLLRETYGVVMFQEDSLRLAHEYAGMSWEDAERFRKRVSKTEDEQELAELRAEFIAGAMRRSDATLEEADGVFAQVAEFRGFGFSQAHAWAFAQHTYASAWMRVHHPAEYWAGVLAEAPGMWPEHTIAIEARRRGVHLLPIDVNRSGVRHHAETRRQIRLPFTAVAGVSEDTARDITMERFTRGPYANLEDFYQRVKLDRTTLEALVRAGAFDAVEPSRRRAFYRVGQLANAAPPGALAFLTPQHDLPDLPLLTDAELLQLDFATKGVNEAGKHPLDPWRGQLRDLDCRPIGTLRPGQFVRTAGLVVAKQRPPTARGAAFWVLSDGPHLVQVIIPPEMWEPHRQLLRDAHALIVEGRVEGAGRYRAMRAERLAELPIRERVRGYEFG